MSSTDTNTSTKPTLFPRLLALSGALIVLGAVIFFLSIAEDEIDVEAKLQSSVALPVSIEMVTPTDHEIMIEVYGSVKPRWSADVTAAVSGRVIEVSESALAGRRVNEGTILVRIEPSRYDVEFAGSELAVKEAELALWQARNANLLAEKQFKRDGREAPNALALKVPQLEIANANLKSAKARKIAAEQKLADTIIEAPFSSFVTERAVSPGQSVNVGDKLLRLVDDKVFELSLHVSSKDWALLAHPLKGQLADIIDKDGNDLAKAEIREAAGFLDEKTRQHRIFLTIDAKRNTRILSGDFVKTSLPGKNIANALSLPEAARTQEGYVWFVDAQSRLKRISPDILFRTKGRIIIKAPDLTDLTDYRVVTIPLASFLPGQKVQPQKTQTDKTAVKEAN